MNATLEKEETVSWKGRTITLRGFVKMIPNLTTTDKDFFLDNKQLVKIASDYLRANPQEKIQKEKKK